MVTLTLTHYGKEEGETQYEFQGATSGEAVDEFVMWIANESFDYRFPPDHIGDVILANAPVFVMGGLDWAANFKFTSDG